MKCNNKRQLFLEYPRLVVITMGTMMLLLLQTLTITSAFVTKSTARRHHHVGWGRHLAKNDDKENDENFYEDFGGQVIGGGSGNTNNNNNNNNLWSSFPSNTQLQERIRVLQQDEFVKEAQIKRNWKIGNWKVRGFALDPDPPTSSVKGSSDSLDDHTKSISRVKEDRSINDDGSSTTPRQKIQVSRLYWDKSSLASARPRILVGRTDGSLFMVQLGTEYLTKLSTTATPEDNGTINNLGFSFAPLEETKNKQDAYEQEFDDDEEEEENELVYGANHQNNVPVPSVPFKICHSFQAATSEICAILSLEDEPFILTASKGEGTITQWQLLEEEDDEDDDDDDDDEADRGGVSSQPFRTFQGAHDGSTILYLNAISSKRTSKIDDDDTVESPDVLISVSVDGVVALWNLQDGKLLLKFQAQIPDDADNDEDGSASTSSGVSVASAAVDVASGVLVLGMTSGHVLAYAARELLPTKAAVNIEDDESDKVGPLLLQPNGRFLAVDKGAVTAMACAGSGSLVRQKRGQSASLVLLTGGVDGIVKQWEILPVKSGAQPGATKLEHWPRLANQRLSKKAHLFKGGHESAVRVIVTNDSTKFLSASEDGSVVAWSATKGQELFRMDGFSDKISSLLLLDYLLITDGMEDYVCVHDFEVDGSEVEEGYEFEW